MQIKQLELPNGKTIDVKASPTWEIRVEPNTQRPPRIIAVKRPSEQK